VGPGGAAVTATFGARRSYFSPYPRVDQIASLPPTPNLRREQIKLQVALIAPLLHVKGFAAPEAKAATEHASLLIERATAVGEPPDDPLALFSVLYSFAIAQFNAFDGDAMRALAQQFLALAEKQKSKIPLMIGHRLTGHSLLMTGDIVQARAHYDLSLTLYDPAEHRPLAARFGVDAKGTALSYRSIALWLLGLPDASRRDAGEALREAREIAHAPTLMSALCFTSFIEFCRGNCPSANALLRELLTLAEEKSASLWRAAAKLFQGEVLALTGKSSDAVRQITSGIIGYRSTGTTMWLPIYLSFLAGAYADLRQFDDARRCISEAMVIIDTTKETWWEAEVNRVAGEIALQSPERDTSKAEDYFERALVVARQQQAKSWELRASMSLARLWRDQGKVQQARELLAPVYGWFTEGFDTRDLKEAKALLEELAA
jgi:predicted ATPase